MGLLGLVPIAVKLHITPRFKTSGLEQSWRSPKRAVLTCSRQTDSSSAWFRLSYCWRCLCWQQWQLSPTTIMTWAGSMATARDSTSSAPMEKPSLQPGATTVSRMDPTACGCLNASPHLRVWGSPLTVGGTISTVPVWNGMCASAYWTVEIVIDRIDSMLINFLFQVMDKSKRICRSSHLRTSNWVHTCNWCFTELFKSLLFDSAVFPSLFYIFVYMALSLVFLTDQSVAIT